MSSCIIFETWKASILVGLGAIPGSLIRFKLLGSKLVHPSKRYLNILFVNILSTFFLGLLYGSHAKCSSSEYFSMLMLFFGIGLLGSLSTFSTFIFELFDLFSLRRSREAIFFLILSFVGGLLALRIGYSLKLN